MEVPVHLDLLGRPVKEGDYVAVCHHNSLMVCTVKKLINKQIRVIPMNGKGWRSEDGYLKYSNQCVIIGGPDLMMYILKS
jgi:hypothetical protein